MLEIKNLSKNYGNKQALKDVSFMAGSGEIIGLFGENGAGKTTLMKSILGFTKYSGEILLDGKPVSHKNIERISFATAEHSFFPNLNAKGHRDFYREHFSNFREKRFQVLMDFFELETNRPLKTFSYGQQNQFEVILALCQGADYILMDEPFTGNDIFNREDFYKLMVGILEPEETVILSTHLIGEVADYVSRALMLHKGELMADISAEEISAKGSTLLDEIKTRYDYRSDRVAKAIDSLEL